MDDCRRKGVVRPVTFEATLRQIIREELLAFAEQIEGGRGAAERLHVSGEELLTLLHISWATLQKLRADGLPYVRVGKFPRYNLEDVKRFLAARGQNGGA